VIVAPVGVNEHRAELFKRSLQQLQPLARGLDQSGCIPESALERWIAHLLAMGDAGSWV
jgi:hypothetical protein